MEDDHDGDEEDDDDDDDMEEIPNEWSLRKSNAATLDYLAVLFQDAILQYILPVMQKKLESRDWWERESAILAIGAISEGCREGMKAYLPTLIPFLLKIMSDENPLVRSITCWAISRYSIWLIDYHKQYPDSPIFRDTFLGFLGKMMDPNKKVQEAAASAVITMEEKARRRVIPFIGDVLKTVAACFPVYSKKNMLMLYECISTLADVVGNSLNNPDYINILIPPLVKKWNSMNDNDSKLFPLLDCMGAVACALQDGFGPFVKPIYQRCFDLITAKYKQEQEHTDQDYRYDKDVIFYSLDLISGMIEGLGSTMEPLLHGSNFIPLLLHCMADEVPEIRYSAYSVAGEIAKKCISCYGQHLNKAVQILIENLDPRENCSSNAFWCLGEMAMSIGADFRFFADKVLQAAIKFINLPKSSSSMQENVCVTIGRLGLVCPDIVANRLPEFSTNWLISMRKIRHDSEREQCYKGLCVFVRKNPKAFINIFHYLCDAISFYRSPPKELYDEFKNILQVYKTNIGADWDKYFSSFPEDLKQYLRKHYNL